ncbi:MAG: hypothetical protein ACPGVT_07025 [Maricaulaceae bacterium]
MREDMFKVIVERPRRGSRYAIKSKIRYDKHSDRSRVTGKRLVMEATGCTKYLNENLAPLRRYLGRQIGRRWDDVFSEICARLDTGSTVKMHVREHLDDFVTRKVWRDDEGVLMASAHWGDVVKLSDVWGYYFVYPDDGTLQDIRAYCRKNGIKHRRKRWTDTYRKDQTAIRANIKRVSDVIWHVCLRGIWYRFELSAPPLSRHGYGVQESDLFEALRDKTWRDQTRWSVVRTLQLSKKALKAHGLSNNMEASYG